MAKDIKVRFKGEDKGAISTTKKVKGELGDLDKTVNKSSASMMKMGLAIGGAVVAMRTIKRVVGDLVQAYAVQEAAVTKLEAVLRATNNTIGMSSAELQNFASELSRLTAIADEDIIAVEGLMLTFTKIGHDVFPDAIKAAADMSIMFDQQLSQSAIQLGTALNDPIAGVGRLRKIGITFTEEQKGMIASFMELNDLAGAQGVILDELSAEFGGVAEAMGKTTAGSLKILNQAMGDLKEQGGKAILELFGPLTVDIGNFVIRTLQAVSSLTQMGRAMKGVGSDLQIALDAEAMAISELHSWMTRQAEYEEELKTAGLVRAIFLKAELRMIEEEIKGWEEAYDEASALVEKLQEQNTISAATVILGDLMTGTLEDQLSVADRLAIAYGRTEEGIREVLEAELEFWRAQLLVADLEDGEFYKIFMVIENLKKQLKVEEDITGEIKKRISLLPQAGTPPIGGAAGGGAQMLLRPTPEPPTKSMDAIAIFSRALEATIGGLMNFLNLFQSFRAVIQPLQLIFQGMMQVLQPLVDRILQPLIGIFIIIGRVLGTILAPVFEALAVIVDKLAQAFVWLYNKVIRPVGNFIISIFNIVANAMIAFANLFRRKSREIAYRPLTAGHLGEISLGDVYAAGETGMGGTTAGLGSTTSIVHPPDIYVTINVHGNIIGTAGLEEVGRFVAEALQRHGLIGGQIHIEEAIAPMGG